MVQSIIRIIIDSCKCELTIIKGGEVAEIKEQIRKSILGPSINAFQENYLCRTGHVGENLKFFRKICISF